MSKEKQESTTMFLTPSEKKELKQINQTETGSKSIVGGVRFLVKFYKNSKC